MNVNEINRLADAEFMSLLTGLEWHVCADTGGITAQGEFFKFWLDKIRDSKRYNLSYSDIFDTHGHPAPVSLAEAVQFVKSYEVRNVIPLAQVEEISDQWRQDLQKQIDAPCVETAFSADVKPKNICPWGNL
jgi:hypothetical protein